MYNNNNLSVNWTDGMKINKNHFIQTEQYFNQQIHDSIGIQLCPYNYGLLPVLPANTIRNLDLVLTANELSLLQCQAVTLSGCRINISEAIARASGANLQMPLAKISTKENQVWYVLISLNPNKRLPYGAPNPEETPIRHPDSIAQYCLEVLPVKQTNVPNISANHLVVGKLSWEQGAFKLATAEAFIPPCTSVQSNAVLKQKYKEWHQAIGQLEAYSQRVISKLIHDKSGNSLKKNTCHIAKTVAYYIAHTFDNYNCLVPQQAPIHLVIYFMRLARIFKACLLTIEEKEELLTYYSKWLTQSKYGEFEVLLAALCQKKYDHNNIAELVNMIDTFLKIIVPLFEKFTTLDFLKKGEKSFVITKHEVKGENVF